MQHNLNYAFIDNLKALSFVDEVWLFGSRARGDNHMRSDIDLAILCEHATESDWLKIVDIINKADTLLKIDCVRFCKDTMSSEFCNNILKDKKVIYMKEFQWKDSFDTLGNAITRLEEVLNAPELSQIEYMRDAAIQRFEFTIELFWKTLRKILFHEKVESTTPRDTLSKAYQYSLIDDEDAWLMMLDDRNNTSHAYKEEEAKVIFERIKGYLPIFQKTYLFLKEKYQM